MNCRAHCSVCVGDKYCFLFTHDTTYGHDQKLVQCPYGLVAEWKIVDKYLEKDD